MSGRSARIWASVMCSRAACANTPDACASPRSSTTSPMAATFGQNATIATLPISSPYRTKSPRRSSLRSNRSSMRPKIFAHGASPGNLDAWDLAMQGLSYYWRVTRQDHIIAQELLTKAIAIDPNNCQALGVLAASYTFGAHMGWDELEDVAPMAERTALAAIQADSEDAWAHYSLGAFYLITRRFDDLLAEFELALRLNPNFSQAQNYYATALSFCGRWQEGIEAARRAIRLSPRDPFSGALLWLGLSGPIHRTQLRGGDPDGAHRHSSSQRFRRRPSCADRRYRHDGVARGRRGRAASASPRPAQHLARLDQGSRTDQARIRPGALSGRFSAGGSGSRSPPPAPASARQNARGGIFASSNASPSAITGASIASSVS